MAIACAHARSEVRRSRWRHLARSACVRRGADAGILDVLPDLARRHGRLGGEFCILGRRPTQLLAHDAEPAGQLGAVGAVVAQQEGRLAEVDDKLGDVHGRRGSAATVEGHGRRSNNV